MDHQRIFLIGVLVLLAGCADDGSREAVPDVAITRDALYTVVQVRVVPTGNLADARLAAEAAVEEMERTAALINAYDPSSVLALFNRRRSVSTDGSKEEKELVEILLRVQRFITQTEGAFNPLVGPLIRYWEDVRDGRRKIDREELKSLLPLCNPHRLRVDVAGAQIQGTSAVVHLGGVIKGYAVDRGIAFLRSRGYKNVIINAGGDLYASGRKRSGELWYFGIRRPRGEGYFTRIMVSDRAVATSGDYERFFVINGKRYHHIIDPRTGFPSEGTLSSTVVAGETFLADAWATAAVVLGPQALDLLERQNAERPEEAIQALMVLADGTVRTTRGFPFADGPVSRVEGPLVRPPGQKEGSALLDLDN
jgi:thiamine biosynthesis lipoprotein